jgi:putative two-component system response regulator
MLPDINGFEVCRKLKQDDRTSGIPILFLTAMTEQSDEAKGLSIGGSDFIIKPFNAELLKARVKIHLELKSHRDRLDSLVKERTEELARTQNAAIASLAILSEYRDFETGMHIQRTREYVACLARTVLKLYPASIAGMDIELLSQSAQLHDIGKVGIPDAILLKPGKLTPDEFETIKRHTLIGSEVIRRTEQILGSNTFLRYARECAEYHHERWDGSGYPHALSGDQIPISAQIMAIVDVYDALVSKRPYKVAFSHDKAIQTIIRGDDRTRPSHFSPLITQAFLACQDEFQKIILLYQDGALL